MADAHRKGKREEGDKGGDEDVTVEVAIQCGEMGQGAPSRDWHRGK